MEPAAGLTPLAFTAPQRAARRERLREDLGRKDRLDPRSRAALEGLAHALAPDSMDRALPARELLAHDLEGRGGPTAAVCAGDPATATHLTWMVSGMGIRPDTALWGAAHEAAQLAAAQHAAGAPRPVVVAWLRYPAPAPWRVVLDRPAREAGRQLADDLAAWWAHLHASGLRARGTAVHGAVDAHSYGSLVAGHALRELDERGLLPADSAATDPTPHSAERPVETLVVSGAVGLPLALLSGARALGAATGRVFEARAPGDVLSVLGRLGGLRQAWPGAVALPVDPVPGMDGAAVRGHDTSRWTPAAGDDAPRGYRDPGSVTLAAAARVTAGQPLGLQRLR
ncbi:alpha/beta hydrolase [uncultured Micrococcus sp.]|uniref:alpha/beta hydrolase n=1 Tax=uncultured Micrococcus sp. TaxID=114051 RepID=UPI002611533C|nr:alpha/beta hydrolase [uncultured Micrococcus sp.]